MNSRRIGLHLIAAAVVAGLGLGAAPVSAQDKKISLFGQPSVNNDSIWMAIANGYFKEQGLDVDYRVFPSGTTAFQTFKDSHGDIDAFFSWQPIGSRTNESCPNEAHVLSDASGYIQGYLVAGPRPQFLASPDGADKVTRFLRAVLKGREKAEKDFAAVAAYAKATYSLSEAATREQWDTNLRPIALDKVYYGDFCSLSKWPQAEKCPSQPVDFTKLTWPAGLTAIDPKLAAAPPPPC